jgi:hypothetical protein
MHHHRPQHRSFNLALSCNSIFIGKKYISERVISLLLEIILNTQTNYISGPTDAQKLIAEISCFLDDVEHEFGLEDYLESETALTMLIDRARLLQKLLQLIRARPTKLCSLAEIKNSDIARMVEMESNSRDIANHATRTKQELENHFNKHSAFSNHKVIISPLLKITFYSADRLPIIFHEAILEEDSTSRPFLRLKDCGNNQSYRFIFDQLSNCGPIALSIDDILCIKTIEYELNLTVLKNFKVENLGAA